MPVDPHISHHHAGLSTATGRFKTTFPEKSEGDGGATRWQQSIFLISDSHCTVILCCGNCLNQFGFQFFYSFCFDFLFRVLLQKILFIIYFCVTFCPNFLAKM